MEYNIKPTKPPRQEGGFPQTIPQLIQKYKLDSMWEEITKTVKDIIQQELGQKALKGTSLTVKGVDGEEGYIQVLDQEDKPIVEINNSGVEVGEGKTITEGGSEVSKSVEWEDVQNKPETFTPSEHNHDSSYYQKKELDQKISSIKWKNIQDKPEWMEYANIYVYEADISKIVVSFPDDEIRWSFPSGYHDFNILLLSTQVQGLKDKEGNYYCDYALMGGARNTWITHFYDENGILQPILKVDIISGTVIVTCNKLLKDADWSESVLKVVLAKIAF